MSKKKAGLLLAVFCFVVIQFFQPDRNQTGKAEETDIHNVYAIPGNVSSIFKTACYDCHSNHTNYPWYSKIQPGAWLMANHIRDGKEELNFSEFGNYSARRQKSKLKAIAGSIAENEMPLKSYLLLHQEARLSDDEKKTVLAWAEKVQGGNFK